MVRALDRTRIQIAKKDIFSFLDAKPKVMRLKQIAAFLSQERDGWRLAQRTTVRDFIHFLKQHGKLRELNFHFPHRQETLFTWGDVPTLGLLLHLKPYCYYSHYTAMRLHGLTEQAPKVLYLSHERVNGSQFDDSMTQERIDQAFQQPARVSGNFVDFDEWRVFLINSAHTAELGVLDHEVQIDANSRVTVRVTNLERTLIDAAVRPIYSGGVFEVMKAFELAKGTVSVNAIGAMLSKIGFSYPYHQAIGFYLERAGYRPSAVDLMRREPMPFDFYLSHEMGEVEYVPAWRLFIPKGV